MKKKHTKSNLIGTNLRKYRKERNLTQKRLADRSGCHRTYISALESGRGNPTVSTLTNISDELGIPVEKLFTDTKQKD